MIPRPPASLVGVGAEEWTRVVTLLVDRGQWDPLRSTVLLAYCEAYADWHRLSTAARGKELIKQGEKPVPNPLLPVIERAHRSVRAALEELLRPAPWAKAPAPGSSPAAAEGIWCRQPGETARAYAAFCSLYLPIRQCRGYRYKPHEADGGGQQLDLPCIFLSGSVVGTDTSLMKRTVAGNSSIFLWSSRPNDSVSVARPVIGARTVAWGRPRIRKVGPGRHCRPVEERV